MFYEITYRDDMTVKHILSMIPSMFLKLVGDYWNKVLKSMT